MDGRLHLILPNSLGTTQPKKEITLLSDNIWWTRQARIRTERRLLSNAFHSQALLFWYSFYSVSVSIYYLNSPQTDLANKFWIIYSVLVLVVSGFINGFSYNERANLIKENYEFLKTLYGKAKKIESGNDSDSDIEIEYENTLRKCENHLPKDYLEALYDIYNSAQDKNEINPHPTKYQLNNAKFNRCIRLASLFIFYILPLLITFAIKISYTPFSENKENQTLNLTATSLCEPK
jgi:hypothetical protein